MGIRPMTDRTEDVSGDQGKKRARDNVEMAEMAYADDLKSSARKGVAGSTPALDTAFF